MLGVFNPLPRLEESFGLGEGVPELRHIFGIFVLRRPRGVLDLKSKIELWPGFAKGPVLGVFNLLP